jgi:hypothetical protein
MDNNTGLYTLHLTLKWCPDSLNLALRTNRYKRNKSNRRWDVYMDALCSGKKPQSPLERARLVLIRHSHRMLDYDGLVGSLKPVVDALVTCGVIIDDRWNITGKWYVDQRFRPKKSGQILELLVEEISPDSIWP